MTKSLRATTDRFRNRLARFRQSPLFGLADRCFREPGVPLSGGTKDPALADLCPGARGVAAEGFRISGIDHRKRALTLLVGCFGEPTRLLRFILSRKRPIELLFR
jgi:hypothetical protein